MSNRPALEAQFAAGLDALGIAVDADARTKLVDYVELLARWNATYNLTAVREPAEMGDPPPARQPGGRAVRDR